jgi:hypothetical protein
MNESFSEPPVATIESAPRRISEYAAMIRECRPELAPESAEFRGGLLLLLVDSYGPNVDRLVRRSGLPREFVARGVRRLIDNGWMTQGDAPARWSETPPACRPFWLDVEVLLGLSHRRVSDTGETEWAPVGQWVKDFEYQGARAENNALHNEYRKIELHDPEPDFEGPEGNGGEMSAAATPSDAEFTVAEARDRQHPVASEFLGSVSADDLLGGNESADASPGRPSGAPSQPQALVEDWSGANWLS